MQRSNVIASVAALLLSASAALAEPVAYPAKGQSFDQQNHDEYECHQQAQTETGVDPVAIADQATASAKSGSKAGAGGALTGAGVGAMRGAAQGDAGAGALHGAGMGRLIAVIRSRRQMEKQSSANSDLHAQMEKYDQAYSACLTQRGYTVK